MKITILLAVFTLAFVGCAGGSKKKEDSTKTEKMQETETKKMADKVDKKMKAASASADPVSKTTCSMKNDKRFVEVKKVGNGCELAYSKFGNEETVATSLSGTDHCEKIGQRIAGNLENAGFECKK